MPYRVAPGDGRLASDAVFDFAAPIWTCAPSQDFARFPASMSAKLLTFSVGANNLVLNRPLWQVPGEVVALNPSGLDLVIASGEEIHRVDLSTGKRLLTFRGRVAKYPKLSIVPDGNWLVSGDADGAVRVWSMESGDCVAMDAIESSVWAISRISRNGLFVCGTEAGEVIVRQVRGITLGPLRANRFRPWMIEMNDWSDQLIVCCPECGANSPASADPGTQLMMSCSGCDAELWMTSFVIDNR